YVVQKKEKGRSFPDCPFLCCKELWAVWAARVGLTLLSRITVAITPARSAALRWLARALTYWPAPESARESARRFLLRSRRREWRFRWPSRFPKPPTGC